MNEDNNDTTTANKQCFSLLNTRRFAGLSSTTAPSSHSSQHSPNNLLLNPLTFQLCPSMDLMTFGLLCSNNTYSNQGASGGGRGGGRQQGSSLWLHRTLTLTQKLAAVPCEPQITSWRPDGRLLAVVTASITGNTDEDDDDEGDDDASEDLHDKNKFVLSLYHIEEMMLPSTAAAAASSGGGSTPEAAAGLDNTRGKLVSLPLGLAKPTTTTTTATTTSSSSKVLGMVWSLVGKPHPAWNYNTTDSIVNHPWTYQQRYVDQHGIASMTGDQEDTTTTSSVLPSCKTPLTLLGVATAVDHQTLLLNLYLHGRFAILQDWPVHIDDSSSMCGVDMAVSTNLTHLMLLPQYDNGQQHEQQSLLHIMTMIPLRQQRYQLQIITSLTCSIRVNLQTILRLSQEIAASYKSSLKPLDLKLDILENLITKYTCDGSGELTMQSVLLHYVTFGLSNSETSSDTNSILESFFTNVQMNDLLLVRMERSLTTAIANVETQLRCLIYPNARQIVSQTSELVALSQTVATNTSPTPSPPLLIVLHAQQLHDYACQLLLALEHSLSVLIELRYRLRDGVAWLRHAGAQVRAHGTPYNSAQNDAAKKKRVPQAVIQRVVECWQGGINSAPPAPPTNSSTERFLGIRFYDLLFNNRSNISETDNESTTLLRPLDINTKGSDVTFDDNKKPAAATTTTKLCNDIKNRIPVVASKALEALEILLEGPRSYVRQSIQCTQLQLSSSSVQQQKRAMTTRIGQGGVNPELYFDYNAEETGGSFFSPKEDEEVDGDDRIVGCDDDYDVEALDYREWLVVAEMTTTTTAAVIGNNSNINNNAICVHALPLTWTPSNSEDDEDEDDEEESAGLASKTFWSVLLCLPENCLVRDIAFYGDDGKSSLSAGTDGGTGKERRQALGLIIEQRQDNNSASSLELWLVQYDNCIFSRNALTALQQQKQPQQQQQLRLDSTLIDYSGRNRVTVRPMPEDYDEDDHANVNDGILYAKTRMIVGDVNVESNKKPDVSEAKLVVCGSRGIGAVLITSRNGSTSVNLLDLEEDEEEEDEEGEDSMLI